MLQHFLADTWWYAMTRLNDEQFLKLVQLRKKQDFTAAQIVVGIPPEIRIEDENAKSICGSAFDKNGIINYDYLNYARKRIEIMNENNLTAIVYGAWGNHIDWLGYKNMCNWWKQLVKSLDDLDVIYCLTGELDIGCNKNNLVRRKKWLKVLKMVKRITSKPIIVHTMPNSNGFSVIKNTELLSANTFQTGHTRESEINIWKNIYESKLKYPKTPAVNLEPWYEGILGNFYKQDQIKAFWLSVASGAHSICYGAQGIWNVGDGKFLSGWGTQTFEEAVKLDTPEILGKTYNLVLQNGILSWNNIKVKQENNELIAITRESDDNRKITYIPHIEKCKEIPEGKILNIETVKFEKQLPGKGEIVIFS